MMAIPIVSIPLGGIARAALISSYQFTITIRDQSMAEVLENLSATTGVEIIYDDALKNQRVNVRLQDASLEEALHKILFRWNHTIIFEGNKTVLIDMYGAGTSGGGCSSTSPAGSTSGQVTGKSSRLHPPPSRQTDSSRTLSAQEQYWEDERVAGNLP